jgi:hypothetical protein
MPKTTRCQRRGAVIVRCAIHVYWPGVAEVFASGGITYREHSTPQH